jgi:outer membrane biosynthesis protein TonB
VRFDVTETGAVDNAKVIFAAPTRYETTGFQLATLDAVANWRYRPATERGTPIRQEGLIATVEFQASSQ